MTERVSETRNSPLRQIAAPLTKGLARFIYKKAPWISPTMINFFGTGLVFAGANIADKHPYWAAFFIGTGSGMDGIDGSLAREIDSNVPGSVNFKRGAIFDTLGDKSQELILALSRGKIAQNRGDKLGENLASASAVTNPLPSIFRAFSELCGNDVPESGKGIFGLIGTRPGRAVLGTIATVIPEFKGFPLQAAMDALITASNIKTSFDRLGIALKGSDKLLPEKARQEAKVRLMALGLFGITAVAGSLAAYFILNRKEDSASEQTNQLEKRRYLEILGQIEQYCQEMGLNHRFVGGTFTDFIGPNTEFEIDTEIKRIQLIHPNGSTMTRTDKTIKDVDLVLFSADRTNILKAREKFRKWRLEAQKNGLTYPNISAESAWHPGWPKRNNLKQMVTIFEFDKNGQPYLTFDSVKTQISPESLEPWIIIINGKQITIFNPIGHRECYFLRNASGVKRKDIEPIGSYDGLGKKPYSKLDMLERLAEKVLAEGKTTGVDYENTFRGWREYTNALQNAPDPLIRVKAAMLSVYWGTIGTPLAHGVGPLRGLSTLSNRFTG